MDNLAQTLSIIRQKIAICAQRAGRNPADIALTAVSKTQPVETVTEILQAGQRVFGENRVQEAQSKFAGLRQDYPDLKLHLIGPLQTNKAVAAVTLFDVIETLDRPMLATALMKAAAKATRQPACYIEINIGGEPQKSGIAANDLSDFLLYCRKECGLNITGLMCIPPQGHDPQPYFTRMKQLADRHRLPNLSMGMSGDFEAAIECGATSVRIGSGLFGPRHVA